MKKFLRRILDTLHKACTWIAYFGAGLIAVLMLLSVVDVICRTFVGSAIVGSYEISQLLLLSIAFTSFAYGQIKKSHIHVTMFIQLLPDRLCMLAFAITSVLSVLTCGIMAVASFVMGGEAFHSETATWVLRIPHWPFYYLEGVCLALLTIVMLEDMIISFKAVGDKELAAETRKTWL